MFLGITVMFFLERINDGEKTQTDYRQDDSIG